MTAPTCQCCGAEITVGDSCTKCLLETGHGKDRESTAERIFQAALAHNERERSAFIAKATAGNAELLADIEMLLEGYRQEGGDMATITGGDMATTSTDLAITSAEEPGTVIDHFRLVRLIGEGGMGSVWEAQQTGSVKRKVALKVIKLGMDTREVVARFERERQTLALMKHQNIAQVFEAGATLTGRPYFAMELVDGEPITDYCDRIRLDVKGRIRLFIEVCSAIQHAHQKGVIHRDLKPSNILVMDGQAKVIDFGVAKATQPEPNSENLLHTQQSQILGTPPYMSPEQAAGANEDIDTRTDVYGLGALLYELLTGSTPFDTKRLRRASTTELERILQHEYPVRPSLRLPDAKSTITPNSIKGDLDWITMKCLEKKRQDRYITANALAEDIMRHLRSEPVSAVAPTPWYHLIKWATRNHVAFVAGLAVAASLVTGTLVSIWQASIAGEEAEKAIVAQAKAERLLQSSRHEEGKVLLERSLALENEKKLFRAKLIAGRAIGFEGFGRESSTLPFLDRYPILLQPDSTPASRAKRILRRRGDYTLVWNSPFTAHHEWHITSVSYNSEGSELATCSPNDHTVQLWDLATGRRLRQISTTSAPWAIMFSPKQDLLAVAGANATLQLFDSKTGSLLQTLEGCSGTIFRTYFSDDGSLIGAADASGQVLLWNVHSGGSLPPVGEKGSTLFDFAFSHAGTRIATVGLDETFKVWDTQTNELVWQFPDTGNDPFTVAFNREGTELFGGLGSGQIVSWNLDTGERLPQRFKDHTQAIYRLKTSPDGKLLASVSWDTRVRISRISDGNEINLLEGHSTRVRDASFSPNQKTIASVSNDNTVRIWDLTTGQQLFDVAGHSDQVACLAFTRDGKHLASAGADRSIQIWNLSTGDSWKIGSEHIRNVVSIDFSPSGTLLASVSSYGIVKFWDSSSGIRNRTASIQHPGGGCTALRFVSESRLATAGDDGTVRIWDLSTSKQVNVFNAHNGVVNSLDLSPDGLFLASAGEDRNVVLWNLESAEKDTDFAGHTNSVSAVRFHPTGRILTSGDESGMVRFWDLRSGLLTNSMNVCSNKIAAIDFSPDGSKLATADADGAICVVGMATGKLEAVLEGHRGAINDILFSQDGSLLATASSDRTVALWEARGADLGSVQAHDDEIMELDWIKGRIVTASGSGVRYWDGSNFQQLPGWHFPTVVTSIDEHPDHSVIAAGTSEGKVVICNVGNSNIVTTFLAHFDQIDDVKFSPNHQHLATVGKDGWIRIWKVENGTLLHSIKIGTARSQNDLVPRSLCFDRDGSRLFCSGDPSGNIRTWRTSDYSPSITLQGHTLSVRSLDYHPDRPVLLSGSADETIRLWDTETMKSLTVLTAHTGEVYDARFAPSGSQLASASEDQTIVVWDFDSREPVETHEGHVGGVRAVHFDASGNFLASTGEDGTLRMWNMELANPERYAADYEKFKTDGLSFRTDIPPTTDGLGSFNQIPSMHIPRSTLLGALKETTTSSPTRLLFWRCLQAGNWKAAHFHWQQLPQNERETERQAICGTLARQVLSRRSTGNSRVSDAMLALAEDMGGELHEVQAARSILSLHSDQSGAALGLVAKTLQRLGTERQDLRNLLIKERFLWNLEHGALPNARTDLQELVLLSDPDRWPKLLELDAYSRRALNLLAANLSTSDPEAETSLRGLALIEFFRSAIVLSPYDDELLSELLLQLTEWGATVNPPLTLVHSRSRWNYLDQGTDPGFQWIQADFNDQDWRSGKPPLGFGSKSKFTTILRRNASGLRTDPSWITYYFRFAFKGTDLGPRRQLLFDCQFDDGLIVYLNGDEIGRRNMPDGHVTNETPASVYQNEPGRSEFVVESSSLQETNVVAVEIHQRELSSSDIYFDLNLSAIGATPETYLASLDSQEITASLDWVEEFLPPALAERWLPIMRFAYSREIGEPPRTIEPALSWLARARIQKERDQSDLARNGLSKSLALASQEENILHAGVKENATRLARELKDLP